MTWEAVFYILGNIIVEAIKAANKSEATPISDAIGKAGTAAEVDPLLDQLATENDGGPEK